MKKKKTTFELEKIAPQYFIPFLSHPRTRSEVPSSFVIQRGKTYKAQVRKQQLTTLIKDVRFHKACIRARPAERLGP